MWFIIIPASVEVQRELPAYLFKVLFDLVIAESTGVHSIELLQVERPSATLHTSLLPDR